MRRAAKVDANQAEIVRALRAVGARVHVTSSLGGGFPDLTVGFRGQTFLLEVKQPGEKLTPRECVFFAEWTGHSAVVYSVDNALAAIGAVKRIG